MAKTTRNDERYEALVELLETTEAVWEASRLFFARWDLSSSQFNILKLLHETPAGMTQTELSRRLIMHRSNMTGLADRMERRGLLRREKVPGDRRAFHLALTPEGSRLIAEILPLYHETAGRLWRGIAARDIPAFRRHLAALRDNLNHIHP